MMANMDKDVQNIDLDGQSQTKTNELDGQK